MFFILDRKKCVLFCLVMACIGIAVGSLMLISTYAGSFFEKDSLKVVVDAGHGLIKVGSSLVPFANKFPRNTKLYRLMSTKPGEEPFDVNEYLRL